MYDPLLKTFMTVADCGSFNKAAEKLYITPASVMNHINQLEKHLDLTLFCRSSKGLKLTAAGEIIYTDSKKFIYESEKTINRAKEAFASASKTIRIGSSFLNPCHAFLNLWNQKADDPKAWNFRIIPYDDDHIHILSVIDRLDKDIDFLVGAFNSDQIHRTTDYFKLGTYDLCIAMPAEHFLSKKKVLEIEDLYGETIVMPMQEKTSEFLLFLKNHPLISTEQTHYFYDMDTFNYCEQNGLLLLTLSAWSNVHPSLITLPVNWDMKVPYGLLYAKDPDPGISEFLNYIKAVFK